jgi:ribose/xylose/arabinose/galactoside ABC-type transport system permease subunit
MTDDARGSDRVTPLRTEEPIDETESGAAPDPAGLDSQAQQTRAVPADPKPGDRVWVHSAWEATLLVLLAGGVGLWWLFGGDTDLLRDPALLGDRLYGLAPFLLLATALAMSVRVRAVNLAVGAVAALAALLFLEWEAESQLAAAGLVAVVGLAVGVILTVLVTLLKIPGWAASLGAVVAVLATTITIASQDAGLEVVPSAGEPLASLPSSTTVTVDESLVWVVVAAVMAVSVLGGIIGVLPPVRRRLHACREAATEPGRRNLPAALTTGTGLLGSSLLAAAAGVLWVIPAGDGAAATRVTLGTLEPLGIALALAIVVLGGTSLWGKRGGVFGTLLAALAIFAAFLAFDELGWNDQAYWITVGALALGLLVSWSVEVLCTRAPRPVEPRLDAAPALVEPEPPAPDEVEASLSSPEPAAVPSSR